MFEKSEKFYADWRDRTGTRKRKSFRTARAALQFEAAQKELAHPKQKAQGRPSPKFSVLDTRATARNRTKTTTQQKASSSRRVRVLRANSAQHTSRT